jgi:hypothetical protein
MPSPKEEVIAAAMGFRLTCINRASLLVRSAFEPAHQGYHQGQVLA